MPPRRASVSDRTRLDHRGRAVSVAVTASAGFASPIGYQTHLMVYGVGGYRFSDFVRLGVPLDLLAMALTVAIAPIAWLFICGIAPRTPARRHRAWSRSQEGAAQWR